MDLNTNWSQTVCISLFSIRWVDSMLQNQTSSPSVGREQSHIELIFWIIWRDSWFESWSRGGMVYWRPTWRGFFATQVLQISCDIWTLRDNSQYYNFGDQIHDQTTYQAFNITISTTAWLYTLYNGLKYMVDCFETVTRLVCDRHKTITTLLRDC